MTGPLASLFAQVRGALDTYVADVCPDDAQMEGYVNGWYAALSAIERHVQDMQKALDKAQMNEAAALVDRDEAQRELRLMRLTGDDRA